MFCTQIRLIRNWSVCVLSFVYRKRRLENQFSVSIFIILKDSPFHVKIESKRERKRNMRKERLFIDAPQRRADSSPISHQYSILFNPEREKRCFRNAIIDISIRCYYLTVVVVYSNNTEKGLGVNDIHLFS